MSSLDTALLAFLGLWLVSCFCHGTEADDSPVVVLDGSCDAPPIANIERGQQPRPVGPLSNYDIKLRTKNNSLGFVRVRSNAVWSAGDQSNVIGVLPTGVVVYCAGPLKNGEFSAGIGYALPVRDRRGRLCRGYVSASVVAPIDPG